MDGWEKILQEARTLAKARKLGVATPALYAIDFVTNTLTFEFVEGKSIKDILLQSAPLPSPGNQPPSSLLFDFSLNVGGNLL
jgi:TP53 regulating kinase-like protein